MSTDTPEGMLIGTWEGKFNLDHQVIEKTNLKMYPRCQTI